MSEPVLNPASMGRGRLSPSAIDNVEGAVLDPRTIGKKSYSSPRRRNKIGTARGFRSSGLYNLESG